MVRFAKTISAFLDRLLPKPNQASVQTDLSDSSLPDLAAILELEQLRQPPNSLQEMPLRIEMCHRGLAWVRKEESAVTWANLHNEMAMSLAQNPHGSRAENIDEAIAHYQQVLTVYTREAYPQAWAATQDHLGLAYGDRIRGDRAENLEQAIAHTQQALQVYTLETYPEDWAKAMHNLGLAYIKRIRGDRVENFEQAIANFQLALTVQTWETDPENWAMTQLNLGSAYHERICGERAENLEQAIAHTQQAMSVYIRLRHSERLVGTLNNLATTFSERIRGDRAENLEQAISHTQQALAVQTREADPEGWAMTQLNMGKVYHERICGERAENLEQAIGHFQQALTVYTREAFPELWAMTQLNLGNAYHERICGERAENLEQAIAYAQQALQVYTRSANPKHWAATQNNLAAAYDHRLCGERAENLEQAIAHYRQALEVRTLQQFPADFLETQRNLGHLHFDEGAWDFALAAYQQAIRAEQVLLSSAYTEAGRGAAVRETAWLYARSAYALLKLGRMGEGLEQLEQGKARLLSQALALHDVDISALPVPQRESVRNLRQTIRALETEMRLPPASPTRRCERVVAEELHQVRTELRATIKSVRAAYPGFMPERLELSEILSLIPPDAALVAPIVTSQGSAVFVVPAGQQSVTIEQVLWVDDFKTRDLQSLLGGPTNETRSVGWFTAYFNARTDVQAWFDAIETTGQALWTQLMVPIDERLTALQVTQVWLLPQGGLGLLPLHAAWREADGKRHYFLDDYTITYLPSAYTHKISLERMNDPQRHGRSLLAVINPTEDLPFTPVEGEQVARLFDNNNIHVLSGAKATAEAITKQAMAEYVHFSCHGFYRWEDPMQSGLILANHETLTLTQIIGQFNLESTRLVTLSACETGITDIRQSLDECLGLPAGFLQAGAPAVVSTLWAVNDLSTMLLMERFYQLHLKEGKDLPVALCQAQIWLREITVGELAQRFASEEEALLSSMRMSLKTTSENFTRFTKLDPEHRPFVHPYYWAGFTFSGA